jgi:hypothetical protein
MGIFAADPSVVEQFGPYVVSGVIALVGVWLGKLWERRGGTEAWRRDQRLAAYAGMLGSVQGVVAATVDLYQADDARKATLEPEVDLAMTEVRRQKARVELLGPDDASSAGGAWYLSLLALVAAASSTQGTIQEFQRTGWWSSYSQGYDEFLAAARHALD